VAIFLPLPRVGMLLALAFFAFALALRVCFSGARVVVRFAVLLLAGPLGFPDRFFALMLCHYPGGNMRIKPAGGTGSV